MKAKNAVKEGCTLEKHSLPPIAAELDVARRQSEIRMPAREEAFALRHEQEVRS